MCVIMWLISSVLASSVENVYCLPSTVSASYQQNVAPHVKTLHYPDDGEKETKKRITRQKMVMTKLVEQMFQRKSWWRQETIMLITAAILCTHTHTHTQTDHNNNDENNDWKIMIFIIWVNYDNDHDNGDRKYWNEEYRLAMLTMMMTIVRIRKSIMVLTTGINNMFRCSESIHLWSNTEHEHAPKKA